MERSEPDLVDRLHRAVVSLSVAAHEIDVEFPVVLQSTATNHSLVINKRGSSCVVDSQNRGCSIGELPNIALRATLFLVDTETRRLRD